MRIIITSILIFLNTTYSLSQDRHLESYIKTGLEDNLALKQKEFSLEKSLQVLRQARGLYLPSVTIDARYSRAGGGRMIDFPVGDIVNPMHQTLNQLLELQGLPGGFPGNITNVKEPFLRKKEQETKIRTVQPLLNSEIHYNYRIKSDMRDMARAERDIFRRQLIADIKNAYYNFILTNHVIVIYTETEKLLRENLRISESLVRNQAATIDIVYRAEAELSSLDQKQEEARKDNDLAKSYFNFLVNRPFGSEILFDETSDELQFADISLEEAVERSKTHREEFLQLQSAVRAADGAKGLARSAYLPSLNAVFDYGIQGEKYRISKNDDYWMLSLVGQWNIFNGFQDDARRQQAVIEKKRLETQMEELIRNIELQVRDVYNRIRVQEKMIISSEQHLRSTKQTFRIAERKFREGLSTQIEFIDSRTTMTKAEINSILVRYKYYMLQAEFERYAALYETGK